MKIHTNFIGGNSIVKNQTAQAVVLENELRDTTKDWFYWAFCVEGAQGKTITFHLQLPLRLFRAGRKLRFGNLALVG